MAKKDGAAVADGTVEQVPIDFLIPDPGNARLHDDEQIAVLMDLLRTYSQRKPIVATVGPERGGNAGVADRIVRAGNGILEAAKRLGWTSVEVKWWMAGSEEAAQAFALSDNKAADLSAFDYRQVAAVLQRLSPEAREHTAFRAFEIEPLLQASFNPGTPDEADAANGGGTGEKPDLRTILVTAEQYQIIAGALASIRESEGDNEMSDGRALELLAADWLAGRAAQPA